MSSQPSLAIAGSEAITWNAATTDEHSLIWQLAARSCDHISFLPDQWTTWLAKPLPGLGNLRLVACATSEMGYPSELYGLMTGNDFYPFGNDNVVTELLLFLYPETDRQFLEELHETISNWYPRKTNVLLTGYTPVRNPFHQWEQLEEGSSEWDTIASSVAGQKLLEETDTLAMLFSTSPLCMKDARLMEAFIFSEYERCFIRHYYIYTVTGECLYIDGKSAVIFDAWERGCFILEEEEQQKDYLRLFCWALQGDQGQFLITESYSALPLRKKPEEFSLEDVKKIDFTVHIKGNRVNESGMAVGPGIKSADAVVVYDNAVYVADFAINIDTGEMEMLDDITQLNSADLVNEFFGKNRLGLKPDPDQNRYVAAGKTGAEPSASTINTAKQFFYELSEKGLIESTMVTCPVRLGHGDLHKYPSAAKLDTIVFESCTFKETVYLLNSFVTIPIRFVSCSFENGFSASGIQVADSLSFSDCTFQALNPEKSGLPEGAVVDMGYSLISSELRFLRCRFTGTLNLYSFQAYQGITISGCSFTPALVSKFLHEVSIATFRPERRGGYRLGDEDISFVNGSAAIILDKAAIRGNLVIGSAEYGDEEVAGIIGGDIVANNLKAGGQVHIYGTLHIGTLHLEQSELQGDCLFGFYSPMRMYRIIKGGLQMANSICQQTIYFTYMQADGVVSLYFLKCAANVIINGLQVGVDGVQSSEDMLNFTFAEIKGMLVAKNSLHNTSAEFLKRPPLQVKGNVDLSGSNIGHIQICSSIVEGTIEAKAGQFISIQIGIGWRLENEINMREVTSRIRRLNLENVSVAENINFTGLEILRTSQSMERKTETGFSANSGCRIYGCRIGGYLSFFNKEIFFLLLDALKRNEQGYPLRNLDMPEIQKQVKSRVADNLEIEGTTIGGHLQLTNLEVGGVIILNDSDIGFDIRMETGFQLNKIQAEQDADAAFTDENWFETRCAGLDMEKADVGGDLLLNALKIRKSEFPIGEYEYLNGNLHASGAKVRGVVALVHETFLSEYLRRGLHKSAGDSPVACANVAGNIFFTGMHADHLLLLAKNFDEGGKELPAAKTAPRLKLDRACFNKLEIISPTPPLDLSNVSVQDWRFGDDRIDRNPDKIASGESELQLADKYLEILHQMSPFDKSVYVNVERKLRNESKETVANAIYRGMVRRAYSENVSKSRLAAGVLRFFHKIFMNYGTAFWLPLGWWLGIFITTVFCLSSPGNIQLSQPVTNIVAVNDSIIKTGSDAQMALYNMRTGQGDTVTLQMQTISRADISPHDWSKIDAAILASRYCIPFFDLSFQDEWQVAGHMELPVLFLSLLSYIFLSLFLYGVADKAFRKT